MTKAKKLIEYLISKKLNGVNEEISSNPLGLSYKKNRILEDGDGYSLTFYAILDRSNKIVGELTSDSTGLFYGHLYGRDFSFNTREVKGGGSDPKKNMEAWFKTRDFEEWMDEPPDPNYKNWYR